VEISLYSQMPHPDYHPEDMYRREVEAARVALIWVA
jgi:hypothetical protein